MKITKNNLNEVLFENHDARLLIEDVVSHTAANLYYYHGTEISLQKALDIWNRAMQSEDSDLRRRVSCPRGSRKAARPVFLRRQVASL